MNHLIDQLKKDLEKAATKERAIVSAKYFKTGKGEYGEGDIFIGATVPETRKIAKKYDLSLKKIKELLESKIHEYRLIAIYILVNKFNKECNKEEIFNFYLSNAKNINNWDLVDSSAHYIVGEYLKDKNKEIIYKLAKSDNLWERRIAITSTLQFIRLNNFEETFKISEMLMKDKHDLIHKAVGWMLREVGKKNKTSLETFLNKYHKVMPRTMLRYSLEHFSKEKKLFYMKKD